MFRPFRTPDPEIGRWQEKRTAIKYSGPARGLPDSRSSPERYQVADRPLFSPGGSSQSAAGPATVMAGKSLPIPGRGPDRVRENFSQASCGHISHAMGALGRTLGKNRFRGPEAETQKTAFYEFLLDHRNTARLHMLTDELHNVSPIAVPG